MSIQIRDLSYRYPTASLRGKEDEGWALLHINLEIEDGDLLAIVGENGSGKSTLCLTMNGLIPHFFKGRMEGDVVVNGRNTRTIEITDLVREISVVFQNPFDQLTGAANTVYEEVAIGPENMGFSRDEIRARVEQALCDAGVQQLSNRNPFQLSGGQQQRVALASTLALSPKIIVFDEPTSQLDPVGSDEIFDVIKRLHDQGMTIILAEHKIDKIVNLATKVLVLNKGRIACIGTPEEVFTDSSINELGILPPRPTMLAKELSVKHLWSGSLPLTNERLKIGLKEELSWL